MHMPPNQAAVGMYLKEMLRIFWDLRGFLGVLWDFAGFLLGFDADFLGLFGFCGLFGRFCWIKWDFVEGFWDIMGFFWG